MAIVILFVVSLGVSWLVNLIPGSPAALVLGESASPEAYAAFDERFGYNRPILERYWDWLTSALHGDLGTSVITNKSVSEIITSHLGVTVQVALMALIIPLVIAVPLALYCGAHEDSRIDRIVTGICSALFSLPSFVTAVFLSFVFAANLKLLPTFGWSPISDGLGSNLKHTAMPVAALSLSIIPLFVRVLRADVIAVLREDFVLSARAKGLPDWFILLRHVLRPAAVSLFTISALVLGFLLGGSIVIESYFALGGTGQVVAQAVTAKDLPVIQGVVIVVALIYLLLNTTVDLLHGVLDPRVGAKR